MNVFRFNAGILESHGTRRSFVRWWLSLLVVALAGGWPGGTACAQTLQDLFTNRETIITTSGQIGQSNTNATVEPGEPKHGGKTGGHSLWISWVAPTNGVVQFKTETSRFDTLLSAYQFTNVGGTTFADLREAARADDSEGLERESEIEFGVVTGERYEIAVDGYFGATGRVEFSWHFDPLPAPPAQILSSPPDRSVNIGDAVALLARVTNAAAAQFKWYFNGNELNATSTNLDLPNFQPANVGRYKLRVSFSGGVQFYSIPTELQINTDGSSNTLAQAKILDAPGTPLIGQNGGGAFLGLSSGISGGITPRGGGGSGVLRGYNGSQIFNNTYATTDPTEPAHCGVAGGASYWLAYQPPANGTITLDTVGSTYDTVMEVYTYNGIVNSYADLITLACNDNAFGTNGPSRVVLPVVKSRQYLVAVDGVGGARGTAWLNYSMNTNQLPQPPQLTSVPSPLTVAAGTTVTLTAPVTGSTPLIFAWHKDNTAIPGANGQVLVLLNVTNSHTGSYTFTATNDLGNVSGNFPLKVLVAPAGMLMQIANGLQLSFPTVTGQIYTVEESTNLPGTWIAWPGSFVGNGLTNSFNVWKTDRRFYRVRVE